jgi:hypothetical protein
MRALMLVGLIAGVHFAATLAIGVLAFLTQGDLT